VTGPSPRRVVAVVPDLFFAARIAETARASGVTLETIDAARALERCREAPPDLVILDLHGAGDPLALARALKADAAARSVRIVGFYSHVDAALRAAALAAGVDEALPRSAFTARLAQLLAGPT
jgi:CheY-like chemotaxis protein